MEYLIARENLVGWRCPHCGCSDQIDIQASVWLRATADGTDAGASQDGGHEFEADSIARCCACGFLSTVDDFETMDTEPAATPEEVA